ncbi:MAG TPA: diaminopimelate epimerase [Candidatus Eisenbacteria bacterium]|jgi:diaminopimelate epimerase|nr:diaminopimelate epimerase [Candidatus Eisenbacteria bacterium]
MKTLNFVKMVGTGNDFVLVDNRRGAIVKAPDAARRLCDRKLSIGGDGLLLAERSKKADLRMRILNPDGSEAEMCGNGVRCFAKFALDKRFAGKSLTIETLAGLIRADVKGDVVKARMIDPSDLRMDLTLRVDGRSENVHFVNTGVPHVVKVLDTVEGVDVERFGRLIRCHADFAPRGTNANFIAFRGDGTLDVRTYERGVEGETLACGTGSTASALVAARLKGLRSPVRVRTHGGETLKIYFSKEGQKFYDVYLEGKVKKTFEGTVGL